MAIDTGGRPLSPHLQVYKWQLTMLLSILHRVTGVFLSIGTLFIAYWLMAAASGAEAYAVAEALFGSILGQLALLGWSFALYFHLCNGIRHLVWDAGHGFEMDAVNRGAWIVLGAAAVLTAATWWLACS